MARRRRKEGREKEGGWEKTDIRRSEKKKKFSDLEENKQKKE